MLAAVMTERVARFLPVAVRRVWPALAAGLLLPLATEAPAASQSAADPQSAASTAESDRNADAGDVPNAGSSREMPHARLGLPGWLKLQASSLSEAWANPVGGTRPAVVYTGAAKLGVVLSTDEWLEGGEMGAVGLWLSGKNPSTEAVGDAGGVSNAAGLATVRLLSAWVGKRWLRGALDLKLGQLAIDDDFMALPCSQLFINSGFGTTQVFALNVPAPIYPLGALGARLRAQLSQSAWLLAGLYDADAGSQTQSRHAADLRLGAAQGVIALAEARWVPAASSQLSLSGFHERVPIAEFSEQGAARGISGVVAQGQLAPWTGAASTVTLFAQASLALPARRATALAYADLGVTVGGRALGREGDAAGLGATLTRFGQSYLEWQSDRGNPATRHEAALELTYRATLLAWAQLQATAQWLLSPHLSGNDSLVFGLRLALEL